MKFQAVIEAALRQIDEVGYRNRCLVRKQIEPDIALAGFHYCLNLAHVDFLSMVRVFSLLEFVLLVGFAEGPFYLSAGCILLRFSIRPKIRGVVRGHGGLGVRGF